MTTAFGAAISIGSLLCIRALGTLAGMEVQMPKQSHRRCEHLPVLHPDAAGIDVDASEVFVEVGADRDPAMT